MNTSSCALGKLLQSPRVFKRETGEGADALLNALRNGTGMSRVYFEACSESLGPLGTVNR